MFHSFAEGEMLATRELHSFNSMAWLVAFCLPAIVAALAVRTDLETVQKRKRFSDH